MDRRGDLLRRENDDLKARIIELERRLAGYDETSTIVKIVEQRVEPNDKLFEEGSIEAGVLQGMRSKLQRVREVVSDTQTFIDVDLPKFRHQLTQGSLLHTKAFKYLHTPFTHHPSSIDSAQQDSALTPPSSSYTYQQHDGERSPFYSHEQDSMSHSRSPSPSRRRSPSPSSSSWRGGPSSRSRSPSPTSHHQSRSRSRSPRSTSPRAHDRTASLSQQRQQEKRLSPPISHRHEDDDAAADSSREGGRGYNGGDEPMRDSRDTSSSASTSSRRESSPPSRKRSSSRSRSSASSHSSSSISNSSGGGSNTNNLGDLAAKLRHVLDASSVAAKQGNKARTFTYDQVSGCIIDISKNKWSCLGLRNSIRSPEMTDEQREMIFEEFLPAALDLIHHEQATFMIQLYLSELATPSRIRRIGEAMLGHIYEIANSFCGSRVLQVVVGKATPELQSTMVAELLDRPGRLGETLKFKYGSFVLSRIIETACQDTLRVLVTQPSTQDFVDVAENVNQYGGKIMNALVTRWYKFHIDYRHAERALLDYHERRAHSNSGRGPYPQLLTTIHELREKINMGDVPDLNDSIVEAKAAERARLLAIDNKVVGKWPIRSADRYGGGGGDQQGDDREQKDDNRGDRGDRDRDNVGQDEYAHHMNNNRRHDRHHRGGGVAGGTDFNWDRYAGGHQGNSANPVNNNNNFHNNNNNPFNQHHPDRDDYLSRTMGTTSPVSHHHHPQQHQHQHQLQQQQQQHHHHLQHQQQHHQQQQPEDNRFRRAGRQDYDNPDNNNNNTFNRDDDHDARRKHKRDHSPSSSDKRIRGRSSSPPPSYPGGSGDSRRGGGGGYNPAGDSRGGGAGGGGGRSEIDDRDTHGRTPYENVKGRAVEMLMTSNGRIRETINEAFQPDVMSVEEYRNIVLELVRPGVIAKAVNDNYAQHTIFHMVKNLPESLSKLVGDISQSLTPSEIQYFADSGNGSRFVQALLNACDRDEMLVASILDETVQNAVALSKKQYGNYVMQDVMKFSASARQYIIQEFRGNVVDISSDKFGQYTMVRGFQLCDPQQKQTIVNQLAQGAERMCSSREGCFVLSNILKDSVCDLKELVARLRPLCSNPHGSMKFVADAMKRFH